jgi:hypothetical protein
MRKAVLLNSLMNVALSAGFLFLNIRALRNGFEETFVALALFFGLAVIIGNALFVAVLWRKVP